MASISDFEISIIKGMIREGYRANVIQAYFTRPDRTVNPARIQEIKNGFLGDNVTAASKDDINNFIDDFAHKNPGKGIYAPPLQDKILVQFKLNPKGIITTISEEEDLGLNSPDTKDLYNELRLQAISLGKFGHNSLGDIYEAIQDFIHVLPEDSQDASFMKIFMKGTQLKSYLLSYDAYQKNSESYPALHIDKTIYPIFKNLINTFTLLVNLTPKMAALENLSKIKNDYDHQKEAIKAIESAIKNSNDVSDQPTYELLNDQTNLGINSEKNYLGRTQLAISSSIIDNFAISVFKPIFYKLRYIYNETVLTAIVTSVTLDIFHSIANNIPHIFNFIKENIISLTNYTNELVSNPFLQEFIMKIIDVFNKFM